MTAKVVALCGGIGGAKLALGLYLSLTPNALTVVSNPGDDFEHLGLTICPDFDTVLYTLSGKANTTLGWGRRGETWTFMETIRALDGETWFNLGDGDLALHIERTRQLQAGASLTQVAKNLGRVMKVTAELLPVSDQSIRTTVRTVEHGKMPFQRYFVERGCEPTVAGFEFAGANDAKPTPEVLQALDDDELDAIIICPSNPFISIDPILAVPGLKAALKASPAPVVGVSPLIGGPAIKGPTAKMMAEMGMPRDNRAIVSHYGDLVDGWLIDTADAVDAESLTVPARAVSTFMTTENSKLALARSCLQWAEELRAR